MRAARRDREVRARRARRGDEEARARRRSGGRHNCQLIRAGNHPNYRGKVERWIYI